MSQMAFEGNQMEMTQKSPKKRLLFVITQSELGGAQQFLAQLLNHLNRDNFEFAVASGIDGTHELKLLLPKDTPYFVIKNLRRDPHILQDIRAVSELKKTLLQFHPNILFLLSSKAGFIGSYASRKLQKELPDLRVIYRIGGWAFNDPWGRLRKWLYRFLEKRSASWKDYIIVNNQADLKIAQELKFKPRKDLRLIHNGIDPYTEFLSHDVAQQKLTEIASRNTLAHNPEDFKDKYIVGAIANFYPAKGLTYLLQTAALSPWDTIFFIIGDGKLRPQLEKEIIANNLAGKVFLLGKLENAYQYIPAFDVFVLPSVKEGFPWVLLEAMTAKVPVIATSVGAVPEIIISHQSGIIVQPGHPEQISEAIYTLRTNETLHRELIIQGHQAIIKNFTLQAMVSQYKQLLETA